LLGGFLNDQGLGLKDGEVLKRQAMGGLEFQHGNQDASTEALGGEARSDVYESETFKAGVAAQLRELERLRRLARPLAMTIFAFLGLLAALLLYNWIRLEALTTLVQNRVERVGAGQAGLQEDIDKQRAALNHAIQQMASPSQAPLTVSSPGKESEDRAPAPPVYVQRKEAKASKQHQAEPQAASSHGTGRTVPERDRPVAASPEPSAAVPAVKQERAEVHRNPPPAPPDPLPSVQGGSPPPTEQAPPPQERLVAVQKDQREGGESSDAGSSQLDTVIARNHDEIEGLRKLGKRDYIEFALVRSANRQEVAPNISLQLKKVDLKRSRCSLDIYAEDYEFPTDLAIYEPVTVPVRAMWESVVLVINKMGRDSVVGYLSARKGVLGAGR
jgi:hypothetical protein